jgi:hypothetical protein
MNRFFPAAHAVAIAQVARDTSGYTVIIVGTTDHNDDFLEIQSGPFRSVEFARRLGKETAKINGLPFRDPGPATSDPA